MLLVGAGFELVPVAEDRFRIREVSVDVRFQAVGDEPVRMVTVQRDGRREYERVQPAEYTSAELAAFAGTYYSEELDAEYRIFLRDAELKVQRGRGQPIPLRTTLEDEFTLSGDRVMFRRDERGRPASFVLDAGRVRGIRFVRP